MTLPNNITHAIGQPTSYSVSINTYTFPVTVINNTTDNITITFTDTTINNPETYFQLSETGSYGTITITASSSIISFITSTNNNYTYTGFVSCYNCGSNIIVKNINFVNNTTAGNWILGTINGVGTGWICSAYNPASISNCSSSLPIGIFGADGNVNSPAGFDALNCCGGISGDYNAGAITNCITTGDINVYGGNGTTNSEGEAFWGGNGGSAGGIVGKYNSGTITSCYSYGDLNAYGGAGSNATGTSNENGYDGGNGGNSGCGSGLIVSSYNSGLILNCFSYGNININGGNGGNGNNGNNVNSGSGGYGGTGGIGGNSCSASGIVGDYNVGDVQFCFFYGNINAVGGISGRGGNGGIAGDNMGDSGGWGGPSSNGGNGGNCSGIVGNYNTGNITNCGVGNGNNVQIFNVSGGNSNIGGKSGKGGSSPNGKIGNGGNGGTISSIVGNNSSIGNITYCYSQASLISNGGSISSSGENYFSSVGINGNCGGISGTGNSSLISKCYFSGIITATNGTSSIGGNTTANDYNSGSICGFGNKNNIVNCYVSGYTSGITLYYAFASNCAGLIYSSTNLNGNISNNGWISSNANSVLFDNGTNTTWNTSTYPYLLNFYKA